MKEPSNKNHRSFTFLRKQMGWLDEAALKAWPALQYSMDNTKLMCLILFGLETLEKQHMTDPATRELFKVLPEDRETDETKPYISVALPMKEVDYIEKTVDTNLDGSQYLSQRGKIEFLVKFGAALVLSKPFSKALDYPARANVRVSVRFKEEEGE